MHSQCEYLSLSDKGFLVRIGDEEKILEVDNVIICAGQETYDPISSGLNIEAKNIHIIGGAKKAQKLDAKRAIKEAALIAASL
jgi:2,4-dienoyl-CoA reductase (NADPH2)